MHGARAQARADGEREERKEQRREGSGVTTLCGSAVRQDGRSASLTAPNGSAQRTLLFAALEHASLHATEVGSLEAHGTGTALGDPTEAGALVAVHGLAEKRIPSLAVGAAKASVGHTEASSGQEGLLRMSELACVVFGNVQRHLRGLFGHARRNQRSTETVASIIRERKYAFDDSATFAMRAVV